MKQNKKLAKTFVVSLQNLHEFLSNQRKQKKISVQTLADFTNLSKQYIYQFEAGKISNPTIDTLSRIADALGFNLAIELTKK